MLFTHVVVFSQVKYSVATDSTVYHYGDSIHVTITAVNTSDTTVTLNFGSSCQVNYYIDDFNLGANRACLAVLTETTIPAHDSVTWGSAYLPPYPVKGDTLSPGEHAVVGQVVGYWTSDTLWVTVIQGAAMRYNVSTDSSVYHYGDSIHVALTAVNIGSVPDTLWLSYCDVNYYLDNFNLAAHRPCPLVIVPAVFSPQDLVTWELPPFPITDTLAYGNHAVVGQINGYWTSDTLWVTVAKLTGIEEKEKIPLDYTLEDNYPNPFNPTTIISYQLPVGSRVTLKVYDVLGRQIKSLVDERQDAGSHSITFDGTNLPSGVYFYRLQAGSYNATRKLMLLK